MRQGASEWMHAGASEWLGGSERVGASRFASDQDVNVGTFGERWGGRLGEGEK